MASSFVYVTAGSAREARSLARTVVGERLAACANILGPITSVYWWQGAMEEGEETALVLKTQADLVAPLTRRIAALHSYACPCIVALPIAAGNPDFLAWIAAETRPPAG